VRRNSRLPMGAAIGGMFVSEQTAAKAVCLTVKQGTVRSPLGGREISGNCND